MGRRSSSSLVVAAVALTASCGVSLDYLTDGADAAPRDEGGTNEAGAADAPPNEGSASETAAAVSYRDAVLADQPAAYWRLGESQLPIAADEVGTPLGAYTGAVTLAAPGAIKGDPNTAARFDGGTVNAGSAFAFTGVAAFSLEAWIKPSILDGSYRGVLSRLTGCASRTGYYLLVNDADGVRFERWGSPAGASGVSSGASILSVNAYAHVVGSFDGTTMRLFVNGVLTGSDNAAFPIGDSNMPFVIGTGTQGCQLEFHGDIDEVAVYDHALAAERVAAHYRVGLGL